LVIFFFLSFRRGNFLFRKGGEISKKNSLEIEKNTHTHTILIIDDRSQGDGFRGCVVSGGVSGGGAFFTCHSGGRESEGGFLAGKKEGGK